MEVYGSTVAVKSWPVERELIARSKYGDVEISLIPQTLSDKNRFSDAVEACISYRRGSGAKIAIHMPYRGSLGSLQYCEKSMEFARRIDADLVVMHPGEEDFHSGIKNPNGIVVAAEVVGEFCDPEKILRYVGNHRLSGVVADFEHLAKDSNIGLYESVKQLSRNIIHVHLSDADGKKRHMPLGSGSIDRNQIKESLKLLRRDGYDGMFVLENKERDYSLLRGMNEGVKYLRKMFKEIRNEELRPPVVKEVIQRKRKSTSEFFQKFSSDFI